MRSTPSSTSSRFLSTPSARRATACENHRTRPECYFYPRPPRGGRHDAIVEWVDGGRFLSTPSARRATPCPWPPAPRQAHFYPRPPRGGRRAACLEPRQGTPFLSTPSARRATADHQFISTDVDISIHALREEGDLSRSKRSGSVSYFYPRPPRGGRRCTQHRSPSSCWNFYPRPPRGGRRYGGMPDLRHCRFLSTPSARRATAAVSSKSSSA